MSLSLCECVNCPPEYSGANTFNGSISIMCTTTYTSACAKTHQPSARQYASISHVASCDIHLIISTSSLTSRPTLESFFFFHLSQMLLSQSYMEGVMSWINNQMRDQVD